MLGKGLAAVITIIFIPLFTRYLSPQEYGTVTLILLTATYGSTILTFGMNTGFMIRYFKSDENERKTLFTIVLLFFFLVIPLFIILSPFYMILKPIFGNEYQLFHFWLLGLLIWLSMILNFYTSLLRNQMRATLFVGFTIGSALLINILTLIFILAYHLNFWSFFYANLIGNLVFSIIGTFLYRNYFTRISWAVDSSVLKSLLKISWPILPTQIASTISNSADRYILNYQQGEQSVGVYSIGYRFGTLLQQFLIDPFFGSYIPIAYELFVTDRPKFIEYQKKYLILIVLGYVFMVILLSVPFEFLFRVFINSRYWSGFPVIGLIVLTYLFIAIPYIIVVIQTMMEKLQYSMWLSFAGAAIYVLLNIVMIPILGFIGAGIAVLVTNIFICTLTIFINQRLYRIDYNWYKIILIVLIGISTVICQHTFNVNHPLLNIIIKTLWGAAGIFLLFLLNRQQISSIWKVYLLPFVKRIP
jgi:O-antigen/teichoic acid export membrane protein